MPAFELVGADEVERLLRQLPDVLARKVVESSTLAGAKIVAREMRERCPVLDHRTKRRIPGKLKQSIAISRAKKNTRGRANYVIGFKSPGNRYAHLVEFGTGERHRKKSGASSGAMPAHPFVRPAIDMKARESIEEQGRVAGRALAREAQRLSSRIKVWSK